MLKKPPYFPPTLKRPSSGLLEKPNKRPRRKMDQYDLDEEDNSSASEILTLRSQVQYLQKCLQQPERVEVGVQYENLNPADEISTSTMESVSPDRVGHAANNPGPVSALALAVVSPGYNEDVAGNAGTIDIRTSDAGVMNLKDYFETLFPSAPAPTWFQQAFTFLNHDLGAEYCRLMQLWIRFEQLSNWRVSKSRLSDLNRPAMLNDWSKRRTGSVPALSTATLVYRFGESVWTWWCSLQPPWRTYSITNNRPTPLELLVPGNGWHSLNKGGKNGLMLIVTCLKWWREGLESLSEVEKRELETDWYLAVEDISRMLEGLIVYLTK